jgi:thiol peroxidase
MATNKDNSKITFQGKKLTVEAPSLKEGSTLPKFTLTAQDMSDLSSDSFKGKVLVLSVVPSLDTPTCSTQTKRFNQEASRLGDKIKLLTVSMDLPFAQKRWCGAEGVSNLQTGSDYKHRAFGSAFGCFIKEWGLLARAIFVANSKGVITYCEYVPEISSEPNYEEALKAVSSAVESL